MRRIDDMALSQDDRCKLMYVHALAHDDAMFYARWCEVHLRGHYGFKDVPVGVIAYFDDPADALYFNLRFF